MDKNSSISHFNFLAPPLFTVVFFLTLEAGFRLYFFGLSALLFPWRYKALAALPNNILQEDGNPLIVWRLAANQHARLQGADFSTNAYGFRDRAVPLEKPAGVYRLAVLGASFEMGSGVNDTETYSYQLQQLFDQLLPKKIEVLNFGVFGYKAVQVSAAYDSFVSAFKPDVVLIPIYPGFFFSSVPQFPAPLPNRQDRFGIIRTSLASLYVYQALQEFKDNWIEPHLAHDWRQRGRRQSTQPRPLVYTPEVYATFIAARHREGIPVVAVILPHPNSQEGRQLQAFVSEVRRWAEPISGLFVIDTTARLSGRISPWDSIYYGDNHPNARVHRLYAEAIFHELAPYIAARREGELTPQLSAAE
jgi:hypothetical protein